MVRTVIAGAWLGVTLLSGSALAYERHYDFGQAWGDAVRPHQRDEALSAIPRDVMRHRPNRAGYDAPHDPSGNIILEGAR